MLIFPPDAVAPVESVNCTRVVCLEKPSIWKLLPDVSVESLVVIQSTSRKAFWSVFCPA